MKKQRPRSAPSPMPFAGAIQSSFGHHDISAVEATQGAEGLGSPAAFQDGAVQFDETPTLRVAAHEAAHAVQQRAGVGTGRLAEIQANEAADRVVRGESAEGVLDAMPDAGGDTGGVYPYTEIPVASQSAGRWAAGVDLRVSEDGNLAVQDGGQDLWATPALIETLNGTLTGLGSPLSARAGSDTLRGHVPGTGEARELVKVALSHADTQSDTEDPGGMKTRENCNENALNLLGLSPGSRDHDTDMFGWDNPVSGQRLTYDHHGGMGADADALVSARKSGIDLTTGTNTDGMNRDDQKAHYRKDHNTKRFFKGRRVKAADRALGINAFADPEAGDMLQVATNKAVVPSGSFTAHFAPVILKSGSDYVTLENFAGNRTQDGDRPDANASWFFKLYGPRNKDGVDQTFYGENVRTGEYGGKESTMVLRWRRGAPGGGGDGEGGGGDGEGHV